MIVSHKHRFIFLKTRKTAGTSVELALSRYCGPDDIITPVAAEDEVLRGRMGGRGPQNYALPLRMYAPRDWALLALRGRRRVGYNHMPAPMVRRWVGEEVWKDYYKFTIERNPWDAAVSFYYWRTGSDRPAFPEFVRSGALRELAENSSIYSIEGEPVADRVCRFESLADDVREVGLELGLPGPLDLPHAKGATPREKRSYRDLFDESSAAEVGRIFAAQIGSFGYQF